MTFYQIEPCAGGYKEVQSWAMSGLFRSSRGASRLANQVDGVSDAIAWIKPDEPFISLLGCKIEDHLISFNRCTNGDDSNDFYRIDTVIEGYDRDCGKVMFYKVLLSRARRPVPCQ